MTKKVKSTGNSNKEEFIKYVNKVLKTRKKYCVLVLTDTGHAIGLENMNMEEIMYGFKKWVLSKMS